MNRSGNNRRISSGLYTLFNKGRQEYLTRYPSGIHARYTSMTSSEQKFWLNFHNDGSFQILSPDKKYVMSYMTNFKTESAQLFRMQWINNRQCRIKTANNPNLMLISDSKDSFLDIGAYLKQYGQNNSHDIWIVQCVDENQQNLYDNDHQQNQNLNRVNVRANRIFTNIPQQNTNNQESQDDDHQEQEEQQQNDQNLTEEKNTKIESLNSNLQNLQNTLRQNIEQVQTLMTTLSNSITELQSYTVTDATQKRKHKAWRNKYEDVCRKFSRWRQSQNKKIDQIINMINQLENDSCYQPSKVDRKVNKIENKMGTVNGTFQKLDDVNQLTNQVSEENDNLKSQTESSVNSSMDPIIINKDRRININPQSFANNYTNPYNNPTNNYMNPINNPHTNMNMNLTNRNLGGYINNPNNYTTSSQRTASTNYTTYPSSNSSTNSYNMTSGYTPTTYSYTNPYQNQHQSQPQPRINSQNIIMSQLKKAFQQTKNKIEQKYQQKKAQMYFQAQKKDTNKNISNQFYLKFDRLYNTYIQRLSEQAQEIARSVNNNQSEFVIGRKISNLERNYLEFNQQIQMCFKDHMVQQQKQKESIRTNSRAGSTQSKNKRTQRYFEPGLQQNFDQYKFRAQQPQGSNRSTANTSLKFSQKNQNEEEHFQINFNGLQIRDKKQNDGSKNKEESNSYYSNYRFMS